MLDLFDRNGLCSPLPERDGKYTKCFTWRMSKRRGKSFLELKERAEEVQLRLLHNEWLPFYLMDFLQFGPMHWKDVLLVTMLRDPVDRVYSDLLHDGAWSCGTLKQRMNESNARKEQILMDCAQQFRSKFTGNMYSKTFSGSWSSQINAETMAAWNMPFNPNHTVSALHLHIAKLVLQQFHVILILEMWDATSVQLKCHGIDDVDLRHEREGATRKRWRDRGNVSVADFENLHKMVVDFNQFDIQLFQFAMDLAVDRSAQCRDYLTRRSLSIHDN